MNGLNQLLIMDFSFNQSKRNSMEPTKKEDLGFHNLFQSKLNSASQINSHVQTQNEGVRDNRTSDKFISSQFNSFNKKEGAEISKGNTNSLQEAPESELLKGIVQLEEQEEIEAILTELINMLVSFSNNEDTKFVLDKAELIVKDLQNAFKKDEGSNEVINCLKEISTLLEGLNHETLENIESIDKKLTKILKDLSKEVKQENQQIKPLNKERTISPKEKNIFVENSEEANVSLNKSSKAIEIGDLHSLNKDKGESKSSLKENFKIAQVDKTAEVKEPKEIEFVLNRVIKTELLTKVSENGLPAKVNSNNILSQIIGQVNRISINGSNEIKIQLMPENLGKISLKITSTDNVISAKIVAESIQVKEAIETNLNQLRNSLTEKGLDIASVEVSVGQDSEAYRHRQAMHHSAKTKKSASNLQEIQTSFDEAILTNNPYLQANGFDMMG